MKKLHEVRYLACEFKQNDKKYVRTLPEEI